MRGLDYEKIAGIIDHTLLKPIASFAEIEKLCSEAVKYRFASVCVNPVWVSSAAGLLKDTPVKVCSVVAFPLGATPFGIKAAETEAAVRAGAQEVDMVANMALIKAADRKGMRIDIEAVLEAAGRSLVKVIIEACYLTDDEKVFACEIAREAGAHFVKTSTGFGTGGATEEDIRLMRKVVGKEMGVKASGGIRTLQDVITMINAGADRIGASAGVAIVSELLEQNQ